MPRLRRHLVALATIVPSLAACTTVSAARPADVHLGDTYHLKVGMGKPREPAVTWWGSGLGDCGLCEGRSIGQTEIGWEHGWRAGSHKYSAGLFLDGVAPQVDLYAQLGESPVVNWGIGARGGRAGDRTGTAKLYLLHDRQIGVNTRLLLVPGLYWYGNLHDPDGREHGASPAWMAGITQAIGVEVEADRLVVTPQVAIVRVHGELGGDAAPWPDRRYKFDDLFVTLSFGVALRGEPR
jgi:hypothetical protein